MGTQVYALLGALFDAETAFDAGDFAGFYDPLAVGVAVGAEDKRAFLILGYAF